MAMDMFLKISGVDGESMVKGFEKFITVDSFSWGASNPVSFSSGTGLASGKVSLEEFRVLKQMDKASPLLFNA